MNIHEYQAKALFEKFGIAVPKGTTATTPEAFITALADLPEGPTMVKSQIHAGGRGKGTFTNGFKGGVKFCKTKHDAREIAGIRADGYHPLDARRRGARHHLVPVLC